MLAWNDLHANLYLIFWFLVGAEQTAAKEQAAHAIWHTIQSDKTQREMLQRTARVRLAGSSAAFARLEWILGMTTKLAVYRNISAHTAVIFHQLAGDAPIADPWSSRGMFRERHAAIDHQRFWKLLAGDLNALSRYAGRLADELWYPRRYATSLRKPRLLSFALIGPIEDQINRLAQSGAQGRQRSASPQKRRTDKKARK